VGAPKQGGRLDGVEVYVRVGFVRMVLQALFGAVLLVACGPRKETVTACLDPQWCKEQEPLCDNSCDYSIDRSACRACCIKERERCLDCGQNIFFGRCK
jgi:hypothetical protein